MYGGWYQSESIAEQKVKAKKKLAKLQKKNPNIKPIDGEKKITSFWAKAWNSNLKYYADYDNRVSRGKSYIKNGFVFDLEIEKGFITSIVDGSGAKTYDVSISISPLNKQEKESLYSYIDHEFDSLDDLMEGKFPKVLSEKLLSQDNGLFPNLNQIKMSCSCPDGARMCKHVSATLYGVGNRIDEDPLLLFRLRDVEVDSLIKKSLDDKLSNVLKNAGKKTDRVIDDALISDIFGIEL